MNIFKPVSFARLFVFFNISLSLAVYLMLGSGFASQSLEVPSRLAQNENNGQIAFLTAAALQDIQFGHKQFDSNLSSQLFDKYFEYWDPQHRFFLQSDLEEFSHYRTLLDDMTLNLSNPDISAAHEIFGRFKKRLEQNVNFVDEVLGGEELTFTSDDYVETDRKESPYPKDIGEAKVLWKNRLKAEYLEEKLARLKKKEKSKELKKEESIAEKIKKRYHRNLSVFSKFTDEEILGAYLSVLSRLYDPHTDFLTASDLESFEISMNLALVGIGLELRVVDGFPTITKVLPGGPASRTKLKAGDRIVAVYKEDGSKLDLVEMRIDQVVSHIRGKKGTKVTIVIDPENPKSGGLYDLSLIRDQIKLEDQEAKAKLIKIPEENKEFRLGVIELPSFYSSNLSQSEKADKKSSTKDVEKLLAKFKKENVDGVILDLRENGGGSLEEGINLTGLFIKNGPVVQIRDPAGKVSVEKDPDPAQHYDGPLIVLTSKRSASASEILAGALQDYGRALIVGDSSTFGKGTVQALFPLKNLYRRLPIRQAVEPGGAIKLTTNKFYRPSGASTQNKGVIPDIILPSTMGSSSKIGESTLDEALPWDTIKSNEYRKADLVGPYLPELRKNSSARIKLDPEYTYIEQDIERLKKRELEKKLSLNETKRLQMQKEDEKREEVRDSEREKRAKPAEIVYNITVKQSLLPSLPPPENPDDKKKIVENKSSRLSEDDDDDEENEVDAALVEAKRILIDYVALRKASDTARLTSIQKQKTTQKKP